MKHLMRLFAVLVIFGLSGCATTQPNLDERRKKHEASVDAMETAVDEDEKKKKEKEGVNPN